MDHKKITSKQIAKWFINRAASDVRNGGEYLTQLKLQKLLYYAKGFYYVFENKTLFAEKIYAQQFGPVVNNLITYLKKYESSPIISEFSEESDIKDEVISNILNFVYEKVGKFSAYALVYLTHSERPWNETSIHSVIDDKLISDYFREAYLENKSNNFNISSSEIFSLITKNNLVKYKEAFEKLAQ